MGRFSSLNDLMYYILLHYIVLAVVFCIITWEWSVVQMVNKGEVVGNVSQRLDPCC